VQSERRRSLPYFSRFSRYLNMLWTHLREEGEVEREGRGREGEEEKGGGRGEGRNIDCVQRAQLDILMATKCAPTDLAAPTNLAAAYIQTPARHL